MSGHHGNTPAAWTGVTLGLLGFLVGSIALMLTPVNMTVFWVGVAITLAGLVVFVVMARLGMNEGEHASSDTLAPRAEEAGSSEGSAS